MKTVYTYKVKDFREALGNMTSGNFYGCLFIYCDNFRDTWTLGEYPPLEKILFIVAENYYAKL